MDLRDFLDLGLTSTQAKNNLAKFGFNEIKAKNNRLWFKILLSQLKSPLIYVLLAAALVSIFLSDFNNVIAILLAVLITAILGYWQEWKAQKTLEALTSLITSTTKVFRNNQMVEIDTREIVPGDVVLLTIGTRIPGDGIILEAADVSVNEAVLTGESVSVSKTEYRITNNELNQRIENPHNSSFTIHDSSYIYAGTTIVAGVAKMLVINTGYSTKIGQIGKSIERTKDSITPLQKQINQIAKTSALIVLIVGILVFVIGTIKGYGLSEIFGFSVALAVAAIPEGLIVTVTVVLAIGMQRLAKRQAVVRKLLSTETLGSVTTICVDKTGTLTEGKMKVVEGRVDIDSKIENKEKMGLLYKSAILCNDLRDPLEISMMEWAIEKFKVKSEKFKVEEYKKENPRIDEKPFDHKTKLIATLHPDILIVSGAPEVLLDRCNIDSKQKTNWKEVFEEYARNGNRLVGFATKQLKAKSEKLKINEEDLVNLDWLGVIVYEDPVRLGVKKALDECYRAGINIKVITGDYPLTAKSVVDKLEIKAIPFKLNASDEKLIRIAQDGIIEGDELAEISDEQLAQVVHGIVLFARTNPEQKLKIVKALQTNGEIVAMMGDGVNDAPALNQADIGIVVSDASDVAKETADIVLLDSDFAAVYSAVHEGRVIFENIKKTVIYLLSHNLSEITILSIGVIFGLPLPLLTAQILWINVIFEDTIPNLALATEKGEIGIMDKTYGAKNQTIINKPLLKYVVCSSIITVFIIMSTYLWFLSKGYPIEYVRTIVFLMIGLNATVYAYSCRSFRNSLFATNPFNNHYLNMICIISLTLLVLAVYVPFLNNFLHTSAVSFRLWILLIILSGIELIFIEIVKSLTLVKHHNELKLIQRDLEYLREESKLILKK